MALDLPVLVPFILSFASALLLCANANQIGSKLGLLDVPDERKVHARVTPLMGGIVILFAFLPAALAQLYLSKATASFGPMGVWLACIASTALVGLVDDKQSLKPRFRLLLSFLIFGGAAMVEPVFLVRNLSFEHPPFSFGLATLWVAMLFTVVCCVGLVNAINMADGKNGLVIGLCIGWLLLIAMRARPEYLGMIGILLATLSVLLVFNLKGHLFLGDGGAYGFSCAIGMLAITSYNAPGMHAGEAISAEEIVLIFAVPVLDSFRLTFKRLRSGRSPMAADRDHLHHYLLDRFGWPKGLVIYWIAALAPAACVIALA